MLRSLLSRRIQSRRKSLTPRAAAIAEHLEDRTLLAGNVVATFDGSTLELTGDAASNQVDVFIDGNTGAFQVTGVGGTTVNGGASFVRVNSSIDNFKATMGRGSDVVNLTGNAAAAGLSGEAVVRLDNARDTLNISDIGFLDGFEIQAGQGIDSITLDNVFTEPGWFNDINIDGGANNDTILLLNSFAGEDVNLRGRGGSDEIRVENSFVGDDLKIQGDNGLDTLVVFNSDINDNLEMYGWNGGDDLIVDNVSVGGELKMEGGRGHDNLEIYSSTIDWSVEMKGGDGKDLFVVEDSEIFGDLKIRGGDGSDLAIISNTYVGGDLDWHGDDGNDAIFVTGSDIDGNLELNGGNGADLMAVSGTYVFGEAWISGDNGNDAVIISDTPDGSNTIEWKLMIKMGSGNDVVHICGVHTANADVEIDGGGDFDRLLIEDMQNFAGQVTLKFESQNNASVPNRTDQMIDNLSECYPEFEVFMRQFCGDGEEVLE